LITDLMAQEGNPMTESHGPGVLDGIPGSLEDPAGVLGVALAQWSCRDTARDKAAARQAANTAMDAIDELIAKLHRARAELVTEIRQADDEHLRQVDEMLAHRSGDR
jgi:hypothetical protein